MTVQQKQTIRKTLSLMAATFAITFALTMMIGSINPGQAVGWQVEQPRAPMLSPDIDIDWRYTKNGWQQIGSMQYRDNFAPLRTFEAVHPFVWAATVMLAVVGTTIWASSEWEIDRMLRLDE